MVKVYALTCTPTGNAYIGITAGNLAKRFREHKCLAKSGKHHSKQLCAEWSEHGDESFVMNVLETLPDTASLIEKREAELRFLKTYEASGKLLNSSTASFQPTPEAILMGNEASRTAVGNRWTDDANAKRRAAQLGIPKGHGAKISATKQAQKAERERMMR